MPPLATGSSPLYLEDKHRSPSPYFLQALTRAAHSEQGTPHPLPTAETSRPAKPFQTQETSRRHKVNGIFHNQLPSHITNVYFNSSQPPSFQSHISHTCWLPEQLVCISICLIFTKYTRRASSCLMKPVRVFLTFISNSQLNIPPNWTQHTHFHPRDTR